MKTRAGSGGEAAETSSYPWEETMGRLILLLVVMALSSHLERPTTGRKKTEKAVSMTSPEFFEQSYEHSSPPVSQSPLPYNPFVFNHQTPPTTTSPTTYSTTSKRFQISCLCLYRFLNLSTWFMCTRFSNTPAHLSCSAASQAALPPFLPDSHPLLPISLTMA